MTTLDVLYAIPDGTLGGGELIDTDKYEGHTEGPWRTAEGQPYDDEGSHLDIVDANGVLVTETSYFTDNDHPNAQLIADAPLLLAEVKQLQPMADELIAIWEILEEDYPHVDRVIVKELIERKIGDYCEVKE